MRSRIAGCLLRMVGWQVVWTPPPGAKSVVMFYPHTSNWDFPLGVLFKVSVGLDIHWAAKDTLFRFPLRGLLLWLGGVPINRRVRTGMIDQLVARFAASPSFHLCIAPEGTRSKTDHLKTGFYRLAREAGVPLGLAFADYQTKRVGIEQWIELSGDEAADLALLQAFYRDKKAFDPGKAGDIRFRRD